MKIIVVGLIVVAIIAIIVFAAGSVGDAGSASVSNNSSSGSPEEESAHEETAEAIVPDAVAGVDTALYSAWMWIISLVVIVCLAAIIAVILVRWRRPPYDEDVP
ncbi:MAG: hypothetical protein LUQ34_03690 [Euryarchaeota archaeon]|nr:hypothetical protein [Euryarchaeota archaeon]